MAQTPPNTDEPRTDGGMTPDDVRETAETIRSQMDDPDATSSPFRALFAPPTRVAILDVLLQHQSDDLTKSDICDAGGISESPFYDHIGFLVDAGVVVKGEKVANAQTWRINRDHPVAQLLAMAKRVQAFGQTPDLLDEQFVGEPGVDYEPGDHPDDPR